MPAGVVTPIILAAGRSRRMGAPKALAPFDGDPCIALVLRACREGRTGAPLIVLGHEADAVRAALPGDVRSCTNPDFARTGPAASLRIALEQLPPEADAFLLFPVDFPLVTGADVRALLERRSATGRRIVLPSHDRRRGHPALFDRSLEAEFRSLAPDAPLHRVVRDHASEVEHVPVENPGVLLDMDTPEDYERCLAIYRGRR